MKTTIMKKNIKDYLHLYLGCDVQVRKKDRNKEWLTGRIAEVTRKSNHGDWIQVFFDEVYTVIYENWNESSSNAHTYFIGYDEIKPILRPLSDMTEEEARHFAWLCMDSKHHLEEDTRISKDEIDTELHHNDGGNLLDGDVEIYIEVTCRCFEGWVSIMKDGRMGVGEQDQPSIEMNPVDDVAEKIQYLLKQGFDLFGLIQYGLAVDKTVIISSAE